MRSLASEGVFSRDATHVYVIDWSGDYQHPQPKLVDIDLAKKTRIPLNLTDPIGAVQIEDLTAAPDGKIAVLTKSQIWLFDPVKKSCAKFLVAPEGEEFTQFACNPKDGSFFVSYHQDKPADDEDDWGATWISADGKDSMKVGMRRITSMSGPVFDAAGNFYFGMAGDLWQGKLVFSDDPDDKAVDIEAHRCAPLATLETQNTTPDQMGVDSIAPAATWIYTHIHRMGGSGWGRIVRLKVKPASNSGEDLEARLKVYADALRSVQILVENGSSSSLCASRDGKRVFYTEGNDLDTATLIDGDAKPQRIFPQKKTPAK